MKDEVKNERVERTTGLESRLVKMVVTLPKPNETHVSGKQALRSFTSVSANCREANQLLAIFTPISRSPKR